MPVAGRLELTVKISEMPTDVATVENGWRRFVLLCGDREVSVTVRPKMFAKLEEAKAKFPSWVAAITGKLGPATPTGFVLLEPNVQVFESKPQGAREPLA
jgi:hypothetical protein